MSVSQPSPPIKWFSRLRWKLTFSYTWVTVATLLTFELILILGALFFLGSTLFSSLLLDNLRDEMNTHAAPILAQAPPDTEALEQWLDSLVNQQTQINLNGSIAETTQLQIGTVNFSDANQALYILAPNQTILARLPRTSDDTASAQSAFFEEAATQAVIESALNGETNDRLLAGTLENSQQVTAVPIQNNNQLVGVAVLTYQLPFITRELFVPILQVVLLTTIPLTIGAIFIGTIFGFFTSRSMTNRIKKMTLAAEAWSQGDFSVVAQDGGGDELGQLSRRLNQMAEQLQNLIDTSQELATVEERNRLARDLHDSIKQQLFATSMQLGAAINLFETDSQTARTHITTAEKLANQAQKELTGLIQELRPAALDGQGLPEALKAYLQDWSKHTGIRANFRLQNAQTLPLAIEQSLFRMSQEALANIARHSLATAVDVHLSWQDEQFTMTLSDNGVGFDTQAIKSGIGLKSMQERLAMINGCFDINSTPTKGTIIQATVPLKEATA
ncbi:MAG: histidine kinase [Chloroflexota bacterium]